MDKKNINKNSDEKSKLEQKDLTDSPEKEGEKEVKMKKYFRKTGGQFYLNGFSKNS